MFTSYVLSGIDKTNLSIQHMYKIGTCLKNIIKTSFKHGCLDYIFK